MTLRRRHPDVHDAEHARFVEDVRASVSSPPGEETARRHLAAMVAAAEEHAHTVGAVASGSAARGRGAGAARARPGLRLGALAAGALVAFSGTSSVLAAAGVDLPDPVRAPFDVVGIDLPNQSDDGDERVAPRDGDTPPPASAPARSDDTTEPTQRGDRGQSGERRGGQGSRRDAAKDRGRSDEAPGRSRSERGRSGSRDDGNAGSGARDRGPAAGNGTRGQRRGGSGRPASPAPPRSAKRGAGPQRPVKPRAQPQPRRNTPPKAQKRAPVPTPSPAPQPESAPTPAPETTTTTAP